jgi:protein O-mannosyl-transferase
MPESDSIASTNTDALARVPVWALATFLAIATLAVYATTLRNAFVDFDDRDYVTENAHVKAGLTAQNMVWAFRSIEAANWHPLTWISHMADVQFFGLNPAGHHTISIALHAINVVLLFLLLNSATGFRWRSFFVAAFFALHPLNVETVAWISERKSLLSMLFSLLAVACYGWYARAPQAKKYLAVVACFALALLSKPMAVTLPLVLLLLDCWPLRRLPVPFSGNSSQRAAFGKTFSQLLLEKLPLFAMSLASSWITVVAQTRGGAISDSAALPMQQKLGNAIVAYVKYIAKAFWPTDLAYYYPHPGNGLAVWKIAASAVLLIAITALVWSFRERRQLVFGWGLFLITLIPVIGIVQVGFQSMADRYAYIPFIGLFVIVVWEVCDAAAAWHVPSVMPGAIAALCAVALAAVAFGQIGYWRDSVTLFTHARAAIPDPNTRIETNLAAALLDRGQTAEAIEHFKIAESLAPAAFIPHFNIGYALAQMGDNASAVAELQAAVQSASASEEKARALNSLAVAYLDLGRNGEAADAFSALLQINPGSLAGRAGRGQALFNLQRFGEASADFLAAAKQAPAPQLFFMAGRSLESSEKLQEAADAYRQALRQNSDFAEARARLQLLESRPKRKLPAPRK